MAELIDRKALLKELRNVNYNRQDADDLYVEIESMIFEQPTTTEAEIRAMAIDEFIKRLYKIGEYREFDWEDIYRLADEMKTEQLKGE